MIKSRFSFMVFIPVLLGVLSLCSTLFILIQNVRNPQDVSAVANVFMATFLAVFIVLFFGELRKRAISVSVNNDSIIVNGLLGLGKQEVFKIDQLDGFVLTILPSSKDTYEYLYLMKDNKRVATISEFYHQNYTEIKEKLSQNVKNLGYKPYNFMEVITRVFK